MPFVDNSMVVGGCRWHCKQRPGLAAALAFNELFARTSRPTANQKPKINTKVEQ